MRQELLLPALPQGRGAPALPLRRELHQWFTPRWACEAIVERYFPELQAGHAVLEPSCGDGRFLLALPQEVDALGVEIDPALAAAASAASGRTVLTGDFLEVPIEQRFTHAIGNPPFEAATIHRFLARTHDLLEDGGKCGLLLPAYVLQTTSKVMELARRWSISQDLVPRNLFPRLSLPLVFAVFRKSRERTLVGFFLYREASDVAALPEPVCSALHERGRGSVWRRAVRRAFECLGVSQASLETLYAAVERPSHNAYWREKVRQTLQTYPEFRREAAGVWSLNPEGA